MKQHVLENYDYRCTSCLPIQQVSDESFSPQTMVFLKYTTDEEDSYYWGCVGPFNDLGKMDYRGEKSVYFNTPKKLENPNEILETLLTHIRGL
ncbi:MAG: hypothetical protein AAGA10_15715 [Bacteroidota bacterium]